MRNERRKNSRSEATRIEGRKLRHIERNDRRNEEKIEKEEKRTDN